MRQLRTAFCAGLLLSTTFGPSAARTPAGIEIEPAKTRVGLARVNLEIGELYLSEGKLVGTYEVRIPLVPSRNDRGNIEIALDGPLDQVIARGGTLSGWGHSLLDDRTHVVTCRFGQDRTVDITIDTGDRILSFKTHVL